MPSEFSRPDVALTSSEQEPRLLVEAIPAEDQLHRSEAYLAKAQRLSHTGSFGWTPSTGNFHWSDETFRILEYDSSVKPTMERVVQRVHPDDLAIVRRVIDKASRGDKVDITHRLLMPDGSVKFVHVLGDAMKDAAGNLEIVGAVMDVTERMRAEERLRVQHTVAQILAEAVTIEEAAARILRAVSECLGWDVGALWRLDLKAERLRCVEFWHKASIEVSEFERASRESTFAPDLGLPGRVWSSLQPEYVPDVVSDENFPRGPIAKREELHAALAFPILLGGEALGVIEFFSREIRLPDQELLNVLATIGSQIGQFIERKHAEEALREGEAKFRDYAETASDWFWEIGPDYKFTLLSENAFGSDAASRIGTVCWDHALDLETEPEKWRLMRATLESRKPFRDFVFCTVGGSGSSMYVRASGKPMSDANGEFRGYRGTCTDVTAIVRAQRTEDSLRAVEAELAHMNRITTLGELTASIAHEVRQPIAAARINARTALNFLEKRPPDLREARVALDSILRDADRARDIIDHIGDHIKKAPPRKHRFDLNEAINEVLVLARGAIAKHGVSVQTRLAEGTDSAEGDRVQLQQVALNLILNAVEAMSSLEAGPRELLISTERSQDNTLLVAVRDSGPGIDPKHFERVFDAFYTTKSSGLGMGLSICRSIINAHGGRLWADANEPRGAVFQFTLPSAEDEVMTSRDPARTKGGPKTS